ncbi:hypothetical protein D9Q98_002904 [Chlorella vulgaris]|uniref:Uncharacterized protein n=1 Tax=Chlorella vulgaris TaxID=3077 RepID=A0A9D4TVK7_CHLVU|nr:hypothetical protein D9Q98_002904 [Chlorella vulgaris]
MAAAVWVTAPTPPTSYNPATMPLTQNISLSLSIIALCGLVGAGVAVGSGVGMMSMAVLEAEKQQQQQQVAAHSPLEQKVVVSRGFAASGAQQQ